MQIHECARILLDLPGIDEHLGEADAVADVRRASTPLPPVAPAIEALLLLIAAAVTQVALGTGCCDGMGHPCCNDGIGKCSLLTS